jgi:A/G-specific adenine glycosylase
MAPAPDPKHVRRRILRWYSENGREFPWRGTRDPYRVLVSEIMLQQTQAGRVAARFPVFLERFPDIRSLARAPRAEVLRAWRGMGYNNRAVRLHGAVREMVAGYNGSVPREPEELAALPGIGRYTAHAVACFAHGMALPVVDVNVRRVLSRVFRRMKSASGVVAEAEAWELAGLILPDDASGWNQALMDFGATVCTARAPRCSECPVRNSCLSAAHFRGPGRPHARPAAAAAGRSRPNGKEPSHAGIPRRIWRGKIVGALTGRRGPVSRAELLRTVRASGKSLTPRRLDEFLELLEHDGVVDLGRGGNGAGVRLAR